MSELAPRPKLGDILTELKLVDDDQVQAALRHQKKTGMLFGESLLSLGYLAEDDLGWALSNQLGFPFVAVTPAMADPALLLRFSPDFLLRNRVLPLVATDSSLSVVLADPTDDATIARLERMSGCELQIAVGTPTAIAQALDEAMGRSQALAAASSPPSAPPTSLSSPELTRVLDRALQQGAAQIHLDPEGGRVRIRFRGAEGDLTDGGWFEPASLRKLVEGLRTWLGSGEASASGCKFWSPGAAREGDEVPFTALLLEGAEGPSVTLLPEGAAASLPPAAGLTPEEWERVDELVASRSGLLALVAPTERERQALLAAVLARSEEPGRRAFLLGAGPAEPGTHYLRLAAPADGPTVAALARAPGIDLVGGVFGDLAGIPPLLEAAHHDRLVVGAFPGRSAFGFLLRAREGSSPVLLAESLLAVLAFRRVPIPAAKGERGSLAELLVCDAPLRSALQDGGHPADLRAAARTQGFREMGARAPHDLSPALRADLDRHRYLEDAA